MASATLCRCTCPPPTAARPQAAPRSAVLSIPAKTFSPASASSRRRQPCSQPTMAQAAAAEGEQHLAAAIWAELFVRHHFAGCCRGAFVAAARSVTASKWQFQPGRWLPKSVMYGRLCPSADGLRCRIQCCWGCQNKLHARQHVQNAPHDHVNMLCTSRRLSFTESGQHLLMRCGRRHGSQRGLLPCICSRLRDKLLQQTNQRLWHASLRRAA